MNSKYDMPLSFARYLTSLQEVGKYWCLRKEIQAALDLSDGAVSMVLWRAVKKRLICRIRGGFYVILPAEHRQAGCLPALWFIEPLMQYLQQPYYVALLSAASLAGAAHQQVMELQVMTTQAMRPIVVGNQRIHFYRKQQLPTDYLTRHKTPMSYVKSSQPELTAGDLVSYYRREGQLQLVATVLYELAENLQVSKLVELVEQSIIVLPVAQRLGYLLALVNTRLDLTLLAKTIQHKNPRYVPLTSQASQQHDKNTKNKRWHIIINTQLELDEL